MSAETIRRIKRNYELKKTSALRQRLQVKASKKAKCVIGIPTISGIISEPVPKSATHFSLKAIAYKGEHSFVSLSAMDIKFIMMGYDLDISGNKKQLSEKLVTKLKSSEAMPKPGELTQELYDNMRRKTTNLSAGDAETTTNSASSAQTG